MMKEYKETQNINRPELLGLVTLVKETGQSLSVPLCPTTALKRRREREHGMGRQGLSCVRMNACDVSQKR